MLEKIFSVGPPLKGTTSEVKDDKKTIDLHDPKTKDYKADFQKQLKKSIEKKETDQKKDLKEDKLAEKKESKNDMFAGKQKPKAEQQKPSGGIKKKMVEAENMDPNLISKVMASNESEIEIPDFEKNLDLNEDQNSVVINADLQNNRTTLSDVKAEDMPENDQQLAFQPQFDQTTDLEPIELQALPEEQVVNSLDPLMDQSLPASSSAEKTKLSAQNDIINAEKLDAGPKPDLISEVATEVDPTSSEAETHFQNKILEILKKDQAQPVSKASVSMDTTLDMNQRIHSKGDAMGDTSGEQSQSSEDLSSVVKQEPPPTHLVTNLDGNQSFKSHLMSPIDKTGQLTNPSTVSKNDANVDELLSQAKYLVTQGGGEVTVRMSPEGMGEVQLRVMLENGKVNIEMNTQDKSVKKLIEDSLSDLRSSLASHQMSVEHVKINNVTATNTENSAQLQSGLNHENSNPGQKDFWQQMHDNEKRTQKSLSQDMSAGNTKNRLQPEPLIEVRRHAANRYYGSNKGTTLNAVA